MRRWYRALKAHAEAWRRSLVFKTVTCVVRGVTVQLEVSTPLERYRAETYSTKEPETLLWLEQNLRAGDVFMDIAANVGLYALFAATRCPAATVYAFEPESQNFARLCRNIVLNRATNVIPFNCALSEREAFELFHVGELQAGAALHSLRRPSPQRTGGPAVLTQGAVTTTLDALVNRYGLRQPNLIKLDVDGSETDILNGAEAVLKSPELRTVLVEIEVREGEQASPAERRLLQAGFQLSGKAAEGQLWNGTLSRNHIFHRR